MNFSAYYDVDVINGPGTRCTLFVTGCEHKCRGCHNPATWNPKAGELFDEQMKARILNDLADTRINRQGLSLSGGDPLFPQNLSVLLDLLQAVKKNFPKKDIWCWTGYRLEDLTEQQAQLLEYIDVVIDGPYELCKAEPNLQWRGSSNQRVIALKDVSLIDLAESSL